MRCLELSVKYALIISKLIGFFSFSHDTFNGCILLLELAASFINFWCCCFCSYHWSFIQLPECLQFSSTCAYLPHSLEVRPTILVSSIGSATSCEEAMLYTQLHRK